jgi:hypothetical protein
MNASIFSSNYILLSLSQSSHTFLKKIIFSQLTMPIKEIVLSTAIVAGRSMFWTT